jgi:hypothetical protein
MFDIGVLYLHHEQYSLTKQHFPWKLQSLD